MTACLNRMRNLAVSQAWEQWQCWYLEVLRQMELLRRAAMRLMHRKLTMAFNTWREGADLSARQMRLMTACLNRMRNLAMSQAWEQWQFAYLERLRELEKLRRAAMKM